MKIKLERKKRIKKLKTYIIKVNNKMKKDLGKFNTISKVGIVKFPYLVNLSKKGYKTSKKLILWILYNIKNKLYK